MRKLIQGIVQFRRDVRPGYRETFARLALGQTPDSLFIACSDSRVVPNLFASSDPGDLFVVRCVGNLVAPAATPAAAIAASIEYAVGKLGVGDIIVCGHSSCGAMSSLLEDGPADPALPHLTRWLRHGQPALARLRAGATLDPTLPEVDQLGQLNVLAQMEHVQSYGVVSDAVAAGRLGVHGFFFDIEHAEVHAYEPELGRFTVIDETEASRLVPRMHAR